MGKRRDGLQMKMFFVKFHETDFINFWDHVALLIYIYQLLRVFDRRGS